MSLPVFREVCVDDAFWQGWREDLNALMLSTDAGLRDCFRENKNTAESHFVSDYLNRIVSPFFPKQFVPQADLPVGEAYESFIYHRHGIPTRDGLHDFFNGLCWLYFPKTKQHFNTLHQQQIEQLGTRQRGKVRDRLTILDENGFLLACPDALWEALKQKDWIRAFVDLRHLWQESKAMVFGHALLEKLVCPYKAITAHTVRIPYEFLSTSEKGSGVCSFEHKVAQKSLMSRNSQEDVITSMRDETYRPQCFSAQERENIDNYLSTYLSKEVLEAKEKPYIPLQILGIPGWSHETQNRDFYEDACVFRISKKP